jgi:hypothetical protein
MDAGGDHLISGTSLENMAQSLIMKVKPELLQRVAPSWDYNIRDLGHLAHHIGCCPLPLPKPDIYHERHGKGLGFWTDSCSLSCGEELLQKENIPSTLYLTTIVFHEGNQMKISFDLLCIRLRPKS